MRGLAETASAAAGFAFPNDLHIHWSLMIVLYPYITGIVAGAFIVSSLYHVFHIRALKPIARFSLVFAFAFLACATMPLLNHLGHPERAMNMMFTPSPSSAREHEICGSSSRSIGSPPDRITRSSGISVLIRLMISMR